MLVHKQGRTRVSKTCFFIFIFYLNFKAGITRDYFTRYSPASERVASKLATPVARSTEHTGQSAAS
jgi:hypothetical protein